MRRATGLWAFSGFCVTVFCGTLLHFLFDLTGENVWVAPICAVNESTWEHMKLLFIPMVGFALVHRRYIADANGFWCIKLRAAAVGLMLIPTLFYTGRGIFGAWPDWINITIFFVSAAGAYLCEYRLFKTGPLPCAHPLAAKIGLLLIAAAFAVFTVFPPHIPLFNDPLTGMYGLFSYA